MKPPWQMQPQQQHGQHHQPTTNENFRSSNPNDVIQQQHLANLSQIYAQHQALNSIQQHSSVPIFSRPSDVAFNFDHTLPHGIPSRANMIAGFQPNQSTFSPRRIMPSMRVSLLRDIGIAGERDKDTPQITSTESSVIHPNELHQSRLQQLMFNQPDRQITMMGNLHHSGYRQHMQPTVPKELQTATIPELRNTSASLTPHSFASAQISQPISRPSAVQNTLKTDNVLTVVEQKSKEHLVQAMDKVDREISKVDTEIEKLEKKKSLLDKTANQPLEAEKSGSSPQRVEPKHRDLWQVIYAENRKKAEDAATTLDPLCPVYDMPLYNQPSDTQVYQDNLLKNEEMRPKLLKFFKNKRKLENIRERYLCARYNQLMGEWQKKVEEIESNPRYKAREAKSREFFEKLFPEIRKTREQSERIDRVGSRGDSCRSDADFAEIVDGLSEQDNQIQHMRHLAVVPPMLLDKEGRRMQFISNNGFISEPFKEFKQTQLLDAWAEHEKEIFKEKYIQHPKNFHVISSFIEKKSVEDCVLFYYLTKKKVNYKSLVRKNNLKPRKPKSGRVTASQANDLSTKYVDKLEKDEGRKFEDVGNDVKIDKPPSPRMTRARKQTMNWTEEEISIVKDGFLKHGRDFSSIARMVTNKSEQQVKNFYHNYKKKHGLDQLIAESKKKKGSEPRRSRHHQPSPDTSNINEEEKVSENEDKSKKQEDNSEDKKKSSERSSSSPATIKPGTETEVLVNTSHIRTRRTTAALAAAASSEETASSKRATEVTPTSNLAGEPAEKKHKKNEQKLKYQKFQETNEILVVKTKKDEPLKIVVKTESKLDKNITKESAALNATSKETTSTQNSETISKVIEKVISASAVEAPEKPKAEKKSSVPRDTDHDSSATCSADEETTETAEKRHADSPYAFEDDFNDSQSRIRLESVRHPTTATTTVVATTVTEPVSQSVIQNAVLNLTMKSVSSILDRPQSLPPSTIYPLKVTSPDVILTKTMRSTISSQAVEPSRPSSTPTFAIVSTSITTPTPLPVAVKKVEVRTDAKAYKEAEQSIFPVSSLRFTTNREPPKTVRPGEVLSLQQKPSSQFGTLKPPIKDHLKPAVVQSNQEMRYHLQPPNPENPSFYSDSRFTQQKLDLSEEKGQTSVPVGKFLSVGLPFALPGSIIQGKPVFKPQMPIDPRLLEQKPILSNLKPDKDTTGKVGKYPRFHYGVATVADALHLNTLTPSPTQLKTERERFSSIEDTNKVELHKLPMPSHSNLGSIVNGTPIKAKSPSFQPQPVGMQPVVMSSMLQDRRPTMAGVVREALPHHSSPLMPYHLEKTIKQERRSSSSSNISEKSHPESSSNLAGQMRSQQSLHQLQQQKHQQQKPTQPKPKPEFLSEPNLSNKFPPHTSISDPQILASLSLANLPNLPYNMHPDRQLAQSLITQYINNMSGFPNIPGAIFPGMYPPGILRTYSPSGNESIDSSRHNVLTQDFFTAQLMQQKNTGPLSGVSARSSPFTLTPHSLPSSHQTPSSTTNAQQLVTSHGNVSSLLARSHASSPGHSDRLNFIPQHPGVIFNPNASPVRVPSVDYKNYSSPSKLPSHHPPTEPHKTSQSMYMSTHHPMLVQQQFPELVKQEGLDEKSSLQSLNFGLTHTTKSQEREMNPDLLTKEHLQYGILPGMRPKMQQLPAAPYSRNNSDQEAKAMERTQHSGRTAKDLKMKGKVAITPANLINAIIDHKIAADFLDKQQDINSLSKMASAGNVKEGEQMMRNYGVEKHSNPVQTKNLGEHSRDVISNMYRSKDTPKVAQFMQMHEHKMPQKYENKAKPIVIDGPNYGRPSSPVISLKPKTNNHELKQDHLIESSRATNVVQHPFVPSMINTPNQTTTLDSLIRKALLDKETPTVLSNPLDEPRQPMRPASASNRQSPVIQQLHLQPHQQQQSSHQHQSLHPQVHHLPQRPSPSPQQPSNQLPRHSMHQPLPHQQQLVSEPKPLHQPYTNEAGCAPPPTTQAPAMLYSALSFRSGASQAPNSSQMHHSPNVTPRPTVVPSVNPSNPTRMISSSGTFHPQSPISPSISSTQYEPLSDSD